MTVDDLYALPDDGMKYELEAGILVSEPLPGIKHGRLAARITALLGAHVRLNRLGVTLCNDAGFILARAPDTVRGPDISFISRERFAGNEDLVGAFPGAPDLAVEILSPSNTRSGIHAKVGDYLAAGTRLVWVIDSESEVVVVYQSLLAPSTRADSDLVDGDGTVPGFRIEVSTIFEFW